MVELQDGEGPPVQAGIPGLRELTPEAPPLPGSQVESAHGLPSIIEAAHEQTACQIFSAGLLSVRVTGSVDFRDRSPQLRKAAMPRLFWTPARIMEDSEKTTATWDQTLSPLCSARLAAQSSIEPTGWA